MFTSLNTGMRNQAHQAHQLRFSGDFNDFKGTLVGKAVQEDGEPYGKTYGVLKDTTEDGQRILELCWGQKINFNGKEKELSFPKRAYLYHLVVDPKLIRAAEDEAAVNSYVKMRDRLDEKISK